MKTKLSKLISAFEFVPRLNLTVEPPVTSINRRYNMFLSPRTRITLVVSILMLIFPTTVSADPITNPPPGSTRIQFFSVSVNEMFVVPANIGFCPFDVTFTRTGWIRFRDYFDNAGNFILTVETDHIIMTLTANGKSISDLFVRTKKLDADNILTNPDGTITFIQTWAGHASLVHEVGADIGRVTFSLTIDPNTGQELDFGMLEQAGQIGGLWGGGAVDPETVEALLCEQLAP